VSIWVIFNCVLKHYLLISTIILFIPGALGNLGMHSDTLVETLQKHKVIENLLEAACHDGQSSVQECALAAIRSLIAQDRLKQVCMRLRSSYGSCICLVYGPLSFKVSSCLWNSHSHHTHI
jgi:hypothetical protein